MDKQRIGLISTEGNLLLVKKPDNKTIDFLNVSNQFKEDFMNSWNVATEILESNNFINEGLNQTTVLDIVGYRVHNKLIPEGQTFSEAYEEAIKYLNEEE